MANDNHTYINIIFEIFDKNLTLRPKKEKQKISKTKRSQILNYCKKKRVVQFEDK